MSDNKEKRVSKVREMKNDLILDAALEVFAEKGFHDTRLEDIAQTAGFSKASLYNYYKDKEMIFLSLAVREYTRIKERFVDDPLLKLDDTLPFRENVRRMLTLIFSTFGEHFAFVLTLNSFQFLSLLQGLKAAATNEKEEVESTFLDIRCFLDERFKDLVKMGKESGEITSALSAEQLHTYFDAIIFGTIREWHRSGEMGDIPQTVEAILTFLSSGFGIVEK